ncbi:MAG: HEAT repeat domain-containing protein, partial [Candidatus Cloacimonetes bacterium]|nr:HEAT repeat domain-containing protein [Candidatus Cloacimonadota bacterium]
MDIPKFPNLLNTLKTLLEGFIPTTLLYLDRQGKWQRNPSTLKERISNELWYRIWEAQHNKNFIEQLKELFYPFIHDEISWSVTYKIFDSKHINCEKEIKHLLAIIAVLYRIIEYDAYKRNSEIYIADWDIQGKAKKIQYLEKTEKFLNDFKQILDTNSQVDIFFKMINLLKEEEECISNKVSLIIAEEEKLRQHTNDLLTEIRDSEKGDEICDFIYEQISPAIGMKKRSPQALLRPCLELLTNPDIDISSGIQYEASVILGILKDLRSTDILLNALKNCELKYTNIRCNLIYAIGNLHQKKAVNILINVLEKPDSVEVTPRNRTSAYNQSLDWEKKEAIWALGKLGPDAVKSIPILMRYSNCSDRETKFCLAWAMGTIGIGQKKKYGGIDRDVLITLMNLLSAKDSTTFEEAAFALRGLGLPD